jgi:hypothetical protein
LAGSGDRAWDWSALAWAGRPIAPAGADPDGESNDRRALTAALGLSAAGVLAPILVTIVPTARVLVGPPLAADILLALLILAPAAAGFAVALAGLPRVSASLRRNARNEAEQAILRVFADSLLFACAFGSAAAATGSSALALPVAALGLVAAWTVLLAVIIRPLASPMRRRWATALDVALLSALLYLGGVAAAGCYRSTWRSFFTPVTASASAR